jgi:Class II flagellar assembly regulator
MTVIGRIAGPAAPVSAAAASRSAGVFIPDDAWCAETAETAAIVAPAMTSLLGLQETESRGEQKRRVQRHAHDMLAGLAALQRALVSGTDPAATVRELSALLVGVEPTGDSALDEVAQSVRLRVRIELARHGV